MSIQLRDEDQCAGAMMRTPLAEQEAGATADRQAWHSESAARLLRYVGSAFGTGGLQARIKHHQRIAAHPHWHIDLLRAACDLVEVWFTVEALCCEHAWAKGVAQLPGAEVPLPGFGSSDCDCDTHLVSFHRPPAVRKFRQLVANTVNVHR